MLTYNRFTILIRQNVSLTILEQILLCTESVQDRYYIKVHLLRSSNVSANYVREGKRIMYFFQFAGS